jgi:hypothetical protein
LLCAVTVLFALLASFVCRAEETNIIDCSQSSLTNALARGGTILFSGTNCVFGGGLVVETNIVIDGTGRSIRFNGNNSSRIFHIVSGVNFTLIGATIQNGRSTNGSAILVETDATVTLSNCVFTSNNSVGGNGASGADGADHSDNGSDGGNGKSGTNALGGAIYNEGVLSASLCQFIMNKAQGGSGGSGGDGGAGAFRGGDGGNGGVGAAALGGAIYNAGILALTDCTFDNNNSLGGSGGSGGEAGGGAFPGFAGAGKAGAEGSGGAIFSLGDLFVTNSTFSANRSQSGNSADGGTDSNNNGTDGARGPDSFGGAIKASGQLNVVNSTFFNNIARAGNGGDGGPGGNTGGDGGNGGVGSGGGIHNSGSSFLLNCTIVSNSAFGGTNGVGGSSAFPGSNGTKGANRGGNVANTGTFTLRNSLIATNLSGGNGYGSFIDDGFNLSSDNTISLFQSTSFKNINPLIGTLSANGGPTKTIPLFEGSPAIFTDDDANADCLATDQRGTNRLGRCDIGAFEWYPTALIEGRITFPTLDGGSIPASGVQIDVGGSVFTTDTNGFYVVKNLLAGTHTLTPQPAGLFSPTNQTVTVPPNASNVNFLAFEARATKFGILSNNSFQINFFTLPSHRLIVQASTNLIDWLTVSTVAASTNTLFQFSDTNFSQFPTRFYRVIR